MNLKQSLIDNKVREDSGALTSGRYDYQKNWSICKLLEEYKHGKDYVLVFEFHEDLLILDSENNPSRIQFYQIKTNSKNWTLHALLNREKSGSTHSQSIIGKLYYSKTIFLDTVESLNFVSNSGFNTKLKDGSTGVSKKLIGIKHLADDEIKNINQKIQDEFSLQLSPKCEDTMYLIVSDLSLNDHSDHTIGKLATFLQSLNPGSYNTIFLYQTLFEEVKRKSCYSCKDITTFDDLIKYKTISKKQFIDILKTFLATRDQNYDDSWKGLENRLNSESFPVGEIKKFRSIYRIYNIDKTDATNITLGSIIKKLRKIVLNLTSQNELDSSLEESLEKVMKEYYLHPVDQMLYDVNYLKVIALDLIWYE